MVTEPHFKSGGQLGGLSPRPIPILLLTPSTDPSTKLADTTTSGSKAESSRGVSPAAKIRHGQTLSEGRIGGQTDARVSQGEGRTEGGFEGTEALEAVRMRRAYGARKVTEGSGICGGMWVRAGFHLC